MKKNNKIIHVLVLVMFLSLVALKSAVCASGNMPPQKEADESIIAKIHKKDNRYSLLGNLEMIQWNSIYLDNYEAFKDVRYDGVVISFAGEKLGYFPADAMSIVVCTDNFNTGVKNQGGCQELSEGDTELQIPYFPNGKYVDIYNPQGVKIFTIDLTSVAVCNENSNCEAPKENQTNCPSDCKVQNVPAIPGEQKISADNSTPNEQQETTTASKGNNTLLIVVIVSFILIVVGVVIFWLKKRKNDDYI